MEVPSIANATQPTECDLLVTNVVTLTQTIFDPHYLTPF